jgi:hypothetical protein
MTEKEATDHARALTDFQLHQLLAGMPHDEMHCAATVELERRARNYRFWHNDVVAWLALGLAILSLVISIFK